jgi:hypothetical protein
MWHSGQLHNYVMLYAVYAESHLRPYAECHCVESFGATSNLSLKKVGSFGSDLVSLLGCI